MLTQAATELISSVQVKNEKMFGGVKLRNRSGRPVHVQGHISQRVRSSRDLVAKRKHVDMPLTPGNAVSVRFSYRLPTGDYVMKTRFVSD